MEQPWSLGQSNEDEVSAMARTAERKHAISARGFQRATEVHGIAPEDVFFDPLVLPISTGMDHDRRSALELIIGTRRISESFPDCQMTCGLSNASFGLKPAARVVLNSVLLHELIKAGMTSAIVHSSKIVPLNRIPEEQLQGALSLIHDCRSVQQGGTGLPDGVADESFDPLTAFIELFDDVQEDVKVVVDRSLIDIQQRLRDHIVNGQIQHLESDLAEALDRWSALEIINAHLLDGMKTVGELFASGRMQLPFVLQSAEVMKKSVAYLEPYMERSSVDSRGTIVLATVKGDVHDIGKNLVDIILTNNGFTVHNLGIKQLLPAMVQSWRDSGAHAIGMSGLLVKSVMVMEQNIKELNEQNITVPLLLGGAGTQQAICRRSSCRSVRWPPLLRDVMLLRPCASWVTSWQQRLMSWTLKLPNASQEDPLLEIEWAEIQAEEQTKNRDQVAQVQDTPHTPSITSPVEYPVPPVPFFGSRVVDDITLDQVYPFINTIALFRGQWGFRQANLTDEEFQQRMQEETLPVFERLKKELKDEEVLQPRVVYGYFPCNADGDALVVYDPEDHDRPLERFKFPRQPSRKRLCISDYFRPAHLGIRDVIAMQCVTVGPAVTLKAQNLFDSDRYQEYLYVHGLGVETAEALAEYFHARVRKEMGIQYADAETVRGLIAQGYRGARYSFGYPACPGSGNAGTDVPSDRSIKDWLLAW